MLTWTDVFLSELLGTAVLLALGVGVGANVSLPRTSGTGGSNLTGAIGWSLGVFAGVYVAHRSGAHLNPAVTLGLIASGARELAPGVPVTGAMVSAYLTGQLVGAAGGASLAWAAYRQHFDAARPDRGGPSTIAVFATGPGIRSWRHNLVTEAVATFLLVFVLLQLGATPTELGPLAMALVVLGIGLGMGGPTGWAINPTRDLGARIAHAVLPIAGKSGSDWRYAWVPVVGPTLGGVVAGGLVHVL